MTNRLDPYHTGPANDPAAEPTPTELLAWLRGREAVVDRRLEAHREGMLRALDVRLEPVTKQLSELQLQADATDRRLDQHTRSIDETVHDLRRDFTHHLDLHEGLDDGEKSDGMMAGPSGNGQSDLDMIRWAQQLREAYRTFMRYAADPTVPKQTFDLEVHEFREQVFDLTRHMRITLSNREGQGAQAT